MDFTSVKDHAGSLERLTREAAIAAGDAADCRCAAGHRLHPRLHAANCPIAKEYLRQMKAVSEAVGDPLFQDIMFGFIPKSINTPGNTSP